MIRDSIATILRFIVAFSFVAVVAYYGLSNYNVKTSEQSVTETLRVSVYNNRDDSARINKGQFRLDQEAFEKEFTSTFAKANGVQHANTTKHTFSYLDDGNGGVLAVKVKTVIDGVTYQGSCIVDVRA